ncbi:polyamine aminopropyltransferase [Micromonospora sp. DR5-3]|uniref:polyamine aminopropyltransferase n=1 Tax=unclassified Micromonospora TaxID=2617518 RepID=UPI0011D4BF31|nr:MULTISPECIES: polyamine aminopropyltransferase [unclassified Micromonospora]MCW3813673.1 polyamine aminopropyltransferase [Micromonospora sp. DR5-3]TYC25629.1 polyamine aminopropyltransferase [Micromonospora sp. MP36]
MTTDAPAPPRWRAARAAVLLAVFVCAACGLVYELALVALGSYLIGDAVGQASIVLGVMVFAMGVGALAAKPWQSRAAAAFAAVELTLALLGGLSVLGLYAAFAWLDLYGPALVGTAFVLGLLIGAEIPLLMVLLQRIREQSAGSAVADLFAADYVGALLGGLAFPFLLMPVFGQLKGTLVVGAVNAVAGLALVCTVFRADLGRRARLALGAGSVVVALLLGYAWVTAHDFEVTARQQLYRDPVVHAERSRYQEIVLTRSVREIGHADTDLRLFLNGDLQFSSVDEYRYHESLVHPALRGPRGEVLVLGAGDGLALREILKYPDVRRVTVVDLDPAVVRLAETEPQLRELNHHAFADPRVRVLNLDAFGWLRTATERFDVVVADLPDPDETATAKLYTVEFYALIRSVLAPDGRLVVQAGSPYFAPRSYWSIERSVREAGFGTVPYHVDVPSFGDWGFVLAAPGTAPPAPELPADAPPLRFLTPSVLAAATTFPADRARVDVPASTLLQPHVLEYARAEWRGY